MKEIKNQGGSLVAESTSHTVSPISISANTKSPIRILEDKNKAIFPLEIKIENVGGGVVCRVGKCKKTQEEKVNEIKLSVKLHSGLTLASGSGCSDFTKSGGSYISVWSGKPNQIACEIEATGLSDIDGPIQKQIEIHADYSYYVDKTISITVSSP
jgi:hypothetical protein